MANYIEQIGHALSGRYPLIYLTGQEEDRMLAALEQLREQFYPDGGTTTWTCTAGLQPSPNGTDTTDPVEALRTIVAAPHEGFYVLKDLSPFMQDFRVMRALRDAYYSLRDRPVHIIIISPERVVPEAIEKEICIVDVEPPSIEEMKTRIEWVRSQYTGIEIADTAYSEMTLALKGLTLGEIGHVMHRAFSAGKTNERELMEEIFAEKQSLVKKSGYLEFVPPRLDVSQIGGLDVLKDWICKREKLFNQESVDAGLPLPKGILIMGVSGCGKSLVAKVVSALWKVPLFRLDMNLIYSGSFGSAEATFHAALKTVESVAPAILWIDEIENGLGVSQAGAGDVGGDHIFSAFLTWMQEKPPLVFVAATANQIHKLPAEAIRKGRFDQVFFCDLPNDEERAEIISIHLRNNEADPADFDIDYLVMTTENWVGAEIEQAVRSARIDANQEGRAFTTKDIYRHTRSIVPLATTMAEQIKYIRDWAWGRATTASTVKKKNYV